MLAVPRGQALRGPRGKGLVGPEGRHGSEEVRHCKARGLGVARVHLGGARGMPRTRWHGTCMNGESIIAPKT